MNNVANLCTYFLSESQASCGFTILVVKACLKVEPFIWTSKKIFKAHLRELSFI